MRFADAKLNQGREFGLCFDTFGNELAAGVARKMNKRDGQGAPRWIGIDIAREAHVEFDAVRRQIQNMSEARIASASIINGNL